MVKKTNMKEAKAESLIAHAGNRSPTVIWWVLALIVIDAIIYFSIKNEAVLGFTSNTITVTFSLLAVIAAGLVYFNIDKEFVDERKTFMFIGVGVILRFVAELVWIYQEAAGIESLYLSLADIFWYVSYAVILIGLGYKIKKTFIFDKGKIIAGVLCIAAVVSAIFAYNVWREISGMPYADAMTHVLLELYVVFDIFVIALLAILIIPMVIAFNKTFKSYLLIALGFVVFAVYDFIFAEMSVTDTYYLGHPVDILWDSAYILIFGGLFFKYLFLRGAIKE